MPRKKAIPSVVAKRVKKEVKRDQQLTASFGDREFDKDQFTGKGKRRTALKKTTDPHKRKAMTNKTRKELDADQKRKNKQGPKRKK